MPLSDGNWPMNVTVPGHTHYVFFPCRASSPFLCALDAEVNDQENKLHDKKLVLICLYDFRPFLGGNHLAEGALLNAFILLV